MAIFTEGNTLFEYFFFIVYYCCFWSFLFLTSSVTLKEESYMVLNNDVRKENFYTCSKGGLIYLKLNSFIQSLFYLFIQALFNFFFPIIWIWKAHCLGYTELTMLHFEKEYINLFIHLYILSVNIEKKKRKIMFN